MYSIIGSFDRSSVFLILLVSQRNSTSENRGGKDKYCFEI